MSDENQLIPAGTSATPAISLSSIQKLKGDNFLPWKRQIEIILELKNLSKALNEEVVPTSINNEAILVLLNTMDQSHQILVQSEKTAKEMMNVLNRQYANSSAANKHRYLRKFLQYTKVDGDSIGIHAAKMKEMRATLISIGLDISEDIFQVSLINSLPQEYGEVMDTWETLHSSMKTTDFLLNCLQKKEDDIKERGSTSIQALTIGKKATLPYLSIAERKKVTHCGKCHKKGHWAKECPNKTEAALLVDEAEKESPDEDENIVFNVMDSVQVKRDSWVADTGASSHMCNNPDWFQELTIFKSPSLCTVGDGRKVEVLGVGTVPIISNLEDGATYSMTLKQVLLIEKLAVNLISIGSAGDNGCEATFTKNRCFLTRKGKRVVQGSRMTEKLYLLDIVAEKSVNPTSLLMKEKRTPLDWHRALGHAGQEVIEKLVKSNQVKFENKESNELFDCTDCPCGKAKRVHHPSNTHRENEAGRRIHVDLSGKVNIASFNGANYFLVAKDEATEYVFIYLISKKDEVYRAIHRLVVDFETTSGKKIAILQSDQGSEFLNTKVAAILDKEGILHDTSAAYTPKQNGLIERENQTITNMARTMLLSSSLPKSLWSEAVLNAGYIKNRLPTKRSEASPYERLTLQKPTISHIVEWGRPVQILRIDSYIHKFDSRTRPGFIVGHTNRRNTYRVYVPETQRVIKTSDVIFTGHQAPHQHLVEKIYEEGENALVDLNKRHKCNTESQQNDENVEANQGSIRDEAQPEPTAVNGRNDDQTHDKYGRRYIRGQELEDFLEEFRRENAINDEQSIEYRTIKDLERLSQQVRNARLLREAPLREQVIEEESLSSGSIPDPPVRTSSLNEYMEKSMGGDRIESPPQLEIERNSSILSSISALGTRGTQSTQISPPQLTRIITSSPIQPPSSDNTNQAALTFLMDSNEVKIPNSYEEALSGENAKEWIAAINLELNAHKLNNTWQVVVRPLQKISLTAKWVFTTKRDQSGKIERFKARLVARGFSQRPGIDFSETFAPVASAVTLRTILAIAASLKLAIERFDVTTAFLHGLVEETIFMEPPCGVTTKDSECLKLNKALYGLKQAPRAWYQRFTELAKKLGFYSLISDPSVFVKEKPKVMIALYVDDGLVASQNRDHCLEVLTSLGEEIAIRRVTGSFLGMELLISEDSIKISQHAYANKLINKFNMENSKGVTSPLVHTQLLIEENDDDIIKQPYLEAIGSIQYFANFTRPDILFPINLLARFNQAPKEKHWKAVKRVIKYIRQTMKYYIEYKAGPLEIKAYSDSNWGGDEKRHSTSGILILIGGGPVVFCSRKQSGIAMSSAEAEFVSACETSMELKALTNLLTELKVPYKKPTLHIDNQSAIRQIKSNETLKRSRHVDFKYQYVKKAFEDGEFDLAYIRTEIQPADLLTKELAGPKIRAFCEQLQITGNEQSG